MRGASSLERAAVGKGLRLHHGNKGTAENDHDRAIFELLFPDALEHRWKSRIGLSNILKFVHYDDGLFLKRGLHNGLKQNIPVFGIELP